MKVANGPEEEKSPCLALEFLRGCSEELRCRQLQTEEVNGIILTLNNERIQTAGLVMVSLGQRQYLTEFECVGSECAAGTSFDEMSTE